MPDTRAWRYASGAFASALVAGILIVICIIALLVVVSDLNHKVDAITRGDTATAIKGRQARAKQLFVVCAKDRSAVTPAKWADFQEACKGYQTLAQAYRTEGVPAP